MGKVREIGKVYRKYKRVFERCLISMFLVVLFDGFLEI